MPHSDDWQFDPILERELTTRRPAGGMIQAVEIAQLPSSEWIINVKVSWHGDKWLNVCLFEQPTLKTYKRLSSAVRHVVLDTSAAEPFGPYLEAMLFAAARNDHVEQNGCRGQCTGQRRQF